MYAEKEIMRLTNLIVEKFNPEKIILFGSQAEGTATKDSDIDLCVVADIAPDIQSKRKLRGDINSYLVWDCDSDNSLDVIVYTSAQWNDKKDNKSDFASLINRNGVTLHG